MSSDPSEGVFFVVRLPYGWQLCTCRHDEYGPMGLPDFWVEVLGAFLNIWLAHFEEHHPGELDHRHAALEKALGQVVAGYDAFPRGEVKRGSGRKRFIIRHGELTRAMHVSHREVEDAFGVQRRAMWIADESFGTVGNSARRLRELLPIDERWDEH